MFGWFRKSPEKTVERRILHGHDLDTWHYIGYRTITFVDTNDNVIQENTVFLFVDKQDFTKRSYTVTGPMPEYVEKTHGFITKTLIPWKLGEGRFFDPVRTHPSDFLKDYMLDTYRCVWDAETAWWKTTNDAKYRSAANKQKTPTKKTKVTDEDDNVVKVDFSKD